MHFDLSKELLPGLPPFSGGRMSDRVYDAGVGRHAVYGDGLPYAVQQKTNTEKQLCELHRLSLCGCHVTVNQTGEDQFTADVVGEDRAFHIVKDGEAFQAIPKALRPHLPADAPCLQRTVTETDFSAFSAYLRVLAQAGFQRIWENEIEHNRYCQLQKGSRLIYAAFFGPTGTAHFIDDTVSVPLPALSGSQPLPGEKTEVCQFGLYYDKMVHGVTADCGMLYLIKLPDRSLFLIDAGEYEQATQAAVQEVMRLMRQWTGAAPGEKIRIAAWFCTHAHDDHMDLFGKLVRLYHDELDVQRLIFNFPAFAHYELMPSAYVTLRRLNQYYPQALYCKPHAGMEITLAGVRFQFLQTHEDAASAQGDELIGGFNDASTVLKITFDGVSLLILGDINREAEAVLLSHYESALQADAVQPAHHLINLLERVYPVVGAKIALIPASTVKASPENDRYQNLLRCIPRERMFFASQGTSFWAAEDGSLVLKKALPTVGGPFDESPV